MVPQKITKTIAITIAVLVIAIAICGTPDYSLVGITSSHQQGREMIPRLLYHFFHVSIIHAALNAWCLLSIAFRGRLSLLRISAAYLIAAAAPSVTLYPDTPTVGLSAICYTLLGMQLLAIPRHLRSWFLLSILIYLSIPAILLSSVNTLIHLYAFIAGFIFSFLDTPYNVRK